MTNNVELTLNVSDTIPQFIIVVSETFRIGDTKYQI